MHCRVAVNDVSVESQQVPCWPGILMIMCGEAMRKTAMVISCRWSTYSCPCNVKHAMPGAAGLTYSWDMVAGHSRLQFQPCDMQRDSFWPSACDTRIVQVQAADELT